MESTCKTRNFPADFISCIDRAGSAGVLNNKIRFWDLSSACFDRVAIIEICCPVAQSFYQSLYN